MDLTIDDFQKLLLDLYIVQRENADLRQRIALYEQIDAPEGRKDEEV